MNANSKPRRSGGKATRRPKPHKDFPLYAHKVGRWAKKVRGRTVYFTRVADDPDGQKALNLRLDQKDELGLIRLGNEIGRMRSVFRFATESGLLTKPVAFGVFRKPSAKTLRIARAKSGLKTFSSAEIRAIIERAPQPFKAMHYLGVNAGFGCTDCASLPTRALDLIAGWIDFQRPKTGIPRRVPLWPETVASIREAVAMRKPPATSNSRRAGVISDRCGGWVV